MRKLEIGSDPKRYFRRATLFCAILASGGNLLFPRAALAVLAVAFGIAALERLRRAPDRPLGVIYAWLTLVTIVAFVRVEEVDFVTNIIRFGNFAIALLLLTIYSGEGRSKLGSDLIFIIRPMVYQTILTVVAAYVVPSIFATVPIRDGYFKSFLLVLNYSSSFASAGSLVRPNGFFYEPGVLQIYLNVYIFLIMSIRAHWTKVFPAALAIILTQSTTGILIGVAIIVHFYVGSLFGRGSAPKKIVTTLVVIIMSAPAFNYISNNIENKFEGALRGSAAARSYDLMSGYMIIAKHPLNGIGFNHEEYVRQSLLLNPRTEMLSVVNQRGRNSTNGILMALYSIGIPLGLFYILMFFRQSFFRANFMFSAILLVSLMAQSLTFTPFFALFAFDGMRQSFLRGRNPAGPEAEYGRRKAKAAHRPLAGRLTGRA